MPFPSVNPRQSFPALEQEMLAHWKANNTFQKSLEIRENAPEFNFYDGPPFATGTPHYGHLLAGTIKDVIPRYQTMKGKYVERRFGWDCHGLPIENIVEKKLGISGKKDIEEKVGVYEFNEECRKNVFGYVDDWRNTVERMGRWVDMDNDYKTMDTDFMESVWWVFKSVYDKGLIYESYRVVPYCPRCSTPLSNFEVNQGYADKQDKAVTVKFKVKGSLSKYILAWTTTPWTLPANLGLAVGEGIVYAEILDKASGDTYVLAKDRIATYYKNEEDYTLVREYPGSCLVGLEYEPIFDDLVTLQEAGNLSKDVSLGANAYHVVPGHHVTTESGTGVVHIAPAYGEDDFQIGVREDLGFASHIDATGNVTGLLSDNGAYVFDYNQTVIDRLKAEKKLVHVGTIDHSYPHCWRCSTPLIYRAISAWYVAVEKIKDRMIANNEKIHWTPDVIKHGRFGKWLEGARDWNISRNRYWGSALPVWKSEDGEVQVIGSVEELYQANRDFGDITKIILLRHAQSEANIAGHYDDIGASPLSAEWKQQAEELVNELSSSNIDVILSSPFVRALETVRPLAEKLGIEIEIMDELRETNHGAFSNQYNSPELQIERKKIFGDDHDYKFWGTGESWNEIRARIETVIEHICDKYPGKTVAIVTHGFPVRILNEHLLEKKLKTTRNAKTQTLFLSSKTKKSFDIHKHFVDQIRLQKEGKTYTRIPEVLDCWFESGSMPYASKHYPFERKAEFDETFPADFIAEGLDQTRGWFYTLLILGTALFDDTPFMNVIVNGLVLAEDGKKMSKSLKNYPDPNDILAKYGADALRFYLLSSPVVKADDLRFSEAWVEEVVKKVILPLWNTYSFFTTYANIDGWKQSETRVDYVRHGQTDLNVRGATIDEQSVSGGLNDHELTEEGRVGVRRLAEELKQKGIEYDVIVSTNMKRTNETAKIIADTIGFSGEWVNEEGLRERMVNEKYEGRKWTEIVAEHEERTGETVKYKGLHFLSQIGGAEEHDVFSDRIVGAYEVLLEKYAGKRILIVAHGNVFRALYGHVLGLDHEDAMTNHVYRLANAELVHLPSVKIENPLDRFIMGELQTLIAKTTDALDTYDLQRGARAIVDFMDDLTNWYVRRSRRRFWESGMTPDKQAAYETLYRVLTDLTKIMAPFCPFVSDNVFRALTGRESVHLEFYPEFERTWVSSNLLADMKRTKDLVTLGLALRGRAKIRVRQPLQKAIIGESFDPYYLEIIRDELNIKEVEVANMDSIARKICKPNARLIGAKFWKAVQDIIREAKAGNFTELENGSIEVGGHVLEAGEFEIAYEPLDVTGLEVEGGYGTVIAIDTTITDDLKLEGYARDIVRSIQDTRKEAGYEVSDRIRLSISGVGTDGIVEKFGEYIAFETLSTLDLEMMSGDIEKEVEIEEMKVKIVLKR